MGVGATRLALQICQLPSRVRHLRVDVFFQGFGLLPKNTGIISICVLILHTQAYSYVQTHMQVAPPRYPLNSNPLNALNAHQFNSVPRLLLSTGRYFCLDRRRCFLLRLLRTVFIKALLSSLDEVYNIKYNGFQSFFQSYLCKMSCFDNPDKVSCTKCNVTINLAKTTTMWFRSGPKIIKHT
jgi:hypothetical protein